MLGDTLNDSRREIEVSFGYQCNYKKDASSVLSDGINIPSGTKLKRTNSSFSCFSGAALSANATLANTNICNGLFEAEILPTWDSPNSFRRIPSSPSLTRLDLLSSSLQSCMSNLSCSPTSPSEPPDSDPFSPSSMGAPSRSESFLNAVEVQVAGGAAGEDRVQAVCSEENGWLFCGVYDGFNGRDAADFLAGTLYETVAFYLDIPDWEHEQESRKASDSQGSKEALHHIFEDSTSHNEIKNAMANMNNSYLDCYATTKAEKSCASSHKQRVLNSLKSALNQAENDYLKMVEQEMEHRPDLVSVGSCVLLTLLHGKDLYLLNLGDSRAVLATYGKGTNQSETEALQAVQLTDSHTVDNDDEKTRLLNDHPDDPTTVIAGKVKGKLKVTRALGVGYLKKKNMNDALMGILRVRNLLSPPYVSVQPSVHVHEISCNDQFVVLGSDGLFDFFSNDEVVRLAHSYILSNPSGDPAKYLVEQLVIRAADCAGFSLEELMNIPAGRRRKYHDDVTVIVIILGMNTRTSKASTSLRVNTA